MLSFTKARDKTVDSTTRRHALVFTALVVPLTSLTWLSAVSRVHTTVNYGWSWIAGCVVLLFLLLTSLGIALHRLGAKDATIGGMKKVGYLLVGLVGFGTLTVFGMFSGAPILMHHLTSVDGEITVTVTEKQDDHQKGRCRPRLFINEFTFFTSNYICPSGELFDQIEVASRIGLKGKVSSYGVLVDEIVLAQESGITAPSTGHAKAARR